MKCEDANHKKYPCPNWYNHPATEGRVGEQRAVTYCPVCDGCDFCGYAANPPDFPLPAGQGREAARVVLVGPGANGLAEALERLRAGDGVVLPINADAVWQYGIRADEEGAVKYLVNEREVGPEEFAAALDKVQRFKGVRFIASPDSREGGGAFTLARKLDALGGRGLSRPGRATAAGVLKALAGALFRTCGHSSALLVRDAEKAPERDFHKTDLGDIGVWARSLVLLLEAARLANFRVGPILREAHRLVDEKLEAVNPSGPAGPADLDAPHKTVRLYPPGGQESYTCVRCNVGLARMAGPAAMTDEDWANTKAAFFGEHGRPRL